MRVCVVAGMPGSGKTAVIRSALESIDSKRVAVILNNRESEESIMGSCARTDAFPFRSPCARAKQFAFRVEAIDDADLVICEPPGACLETSAPMINPLYVSRKDIVFAPLITVVDGRTLKDGISKSTTTGLKTWNMIFESDCVAVSFTDHLDHGDLDSISDTVHGINPDAVVIPADPDGIAGIARMMTSEGSYRRPLVN